MKISVVLPNYNGKELLKKNLPKILSVTGIDEVVIVDDASSDGSVKEVQSSKFKVQSYKEKLKIVENEKNLGFASTVNRGVEEATGELVVLLNTDVAPEAKFIEPLVKHFSDPQVFAVGCLQKCKEDGLIVLRGRGVGQFKKGFLIHDKGEADKTNSLWVSGGAGIFRKAVWEELGGMETLYNPFYWEDIDLSYRALKAGYTIVFEVKSIVHHQQYEGTINRTYSPFYIKTIAYRNQILFVWLNISDITYFVQHLAFLPFHLIKSLFRGDMAFITGLFLAIQLIPLIFVKRRSKKNIRHFTDRKIFENFSD